MPKHVSKQVMSQDGCQGLFPPSNTPQLSSIHFSSFLLALQAACERPAAGFEQPPGGRRSPGALRQCAHYFFVGAVGQFLAELCETAFCADRGVVAYVQV